MSQPVATLQVPGSLAAAPISGAELCLGQDTAWPRPSRQLKAASGATACRSAQRSPMTRMGKSVDHVKLFDISHLEQMWRKRQPQSSHHLVLVLNKVHVEGMDESPLGPPWGPLYSWTVGTDAQGTGPSHASSSYKHALFAALCCTGLGYCKAEALSSHCTWTYVGTLLMSGFCSSQALSTPLLHFPQGAGAPQLTWGKLSLLEVPLWF